MSYIIGLDLGINNVGWSIYDLKTKSIEKSGIRLFTPSDSAENRRVIRNSRRRRKRENNRLRDSLNLFNKIKFPNVRTTDSNLLEKRCLGIKTKIEKQDIVNIICYFMSHRGYIPYSDEEVNFIELNGELPCEYFNKINIEKGKYHGVDIPTVKREDNIKEITRLLDTQSSYYPELTKIKEDIISVFKRKREFWEGPGSVNSLTPYGRFKTKEDVDDYNINKKNNPGYEKYIFEDLIGKCKISINDKCVPKANYYAETFDLLNDFINICIRNVNNIPCVDDYIHTKKGYKFSEKALDKIIDFCINNKTVTYTSILKSFNLKIEDIEGYRINKNRKPEFSILASYRNLKNDLKSNECDISWLENKEFYNRIIYDMAIAPNTSECINMIKNDSKIDKEFTNDELKVIKETYLKLKKKGSLGYHSLSEKVLIRAINDMKSTQMNFMQVRRKFDYDKESREFFSSNYSKSMEGMPYISNKYIDDIIASPQVKKTLRQSIKIINAIIDEKKELPYVVAIESTKEMNGKEQKAEIEKIQRKEEALRKDTIEIITNTFGQGKLNAKNILKVMLWKEIDGECPYCGKTKIKLEDVIDNRIEIEHILPLSKTGNDSYNNKTLSCQTCNGKKGNRTPYQFLFPTNEFDGFRERINSLKQMGEDKKNNLLFMGDIDKYTIRFFNRNLRDTAYATTELVKQINLFNYYLEENYNDCKILTMSTPGQLTSKIRDELGLEKNRNEGKYHHVVDASIVASIANTEIGKIIIDSQNDPKYWITKGQNLDDKISYLLREFNIGNKINDIKNIDSDDKIFVSTQVSKNYQKNFSNANILKLIKKDECFEKIEQIDNIYELNKDDKLLEVLFDEENDTKTLLCYDKDRKLFNKLKDIYNKYWNDEGNPFVNYILDKEGLEYGTNILENLNIYGIKASDKKNAPIVKRLRYYSKVSEPFLLEKKNINMKDKTYIGLDSLKKAHIKVYRDNDNECFIFMPINSISIDFKNGNLKKGDKYHERLYKKYIGDKDVTYLFTLYNGMFLEVEKKDGEKINGIYKSYDITNNVLELKNRSELNKTIKVSITARSITVYDVDVLGNKKKRLTVTSK